MSYGMSFPDAMRSVAEIVDEILRGRKASEIPIRQATKFRLVINLATAKALGIRDPPITTGAGGRGRPMKLTTSNMPFHLTPPLVPFGRSVHRK